MVGAAAAAAAVGDAVPVAVDCAESEGLSRFPWVAKIAFTPADARRGLFETDREPQKPLVAAS
jgi:hypothetical protein